MSNCGCGLWICPECRPESASSSGAVDIRRVARSHINEKSFRCFGCGWTTDHPDELQHVCPYWEGDKPTAVGLRLAYLENALAQEVEAEGKLGEWTDNLEQRLESDEDKIERLKTALRYISSPTMGLPPGADAYEYAMEGATEHNARYALQLCIRVARQALDDIDKE